MICRSLAFCALLLAAAPAGAQPTNAEMIGRLATRCLGSVPVGTFLLDAPEVPAYLRAALVTAWQQQGHRVFVDSTGASAGLRLEAPRATVQYARAGRRQYERTVRLSLPFTFTSPEGEVLRAGVCEEMDADTLARAALPLVEEAAYPETVGTRPPPRLVARYAEPLLLGSAVVVSTLLFFSLRSR